MGTLKNIQQNQPGKRGGARPGAGRKPGQVSQAKRDIAEKAKEFADLALATLAHIAGNRAANDAARVSAANAILDRAYGKPTQGVEHSGPDGGPIMTAAELTDEQLLAIASAGSRGDPAA